MFILPGILGLVFLIFVRPFEFIEVLQTIPMLYLAFGLAIFGYAVDVRLGFSDVRPAPQLFWAALFFVWCVITGLAKSPGSMVGDVFRIAIGMVLFYLVAHGVRTFRMFEIIAAFILACSLFVCVICVHQGFAERQCIGLSAQEGRLSTGTPDGRTCERAEMCYGPEAEPGYSYRCEKIGLLGTTAIGDRVRYLGLLQDPNEVSLVVAAALPFAFAFYQRRRTAVRTVMVVASVILVAMTVMLSQSRGGQIVFLAVIGTYFLKKYGWWGAVLGGIGALPILALGGRGGDEASESSLERLECWYSGVAMFISDPMFGVGVGQFTQHHFLTAHNSYVLAAGELGLIGTVAWVCVMWLTIKIPLTAVIDLENMPGAETGRVWALALLASTASMTVGVFFLSFNYHYILWLFIGISGAFYMAVKGHLPNWRVPFGWRDVAGVTAVSIGIIAVIFLYTRGKV
ncbi:MAG: O-antigen ligase family protein [Polyangiaceae bacterium]|nr:O-antigen ligase family protein [Polyangiaceae bacterium]